MPVLDPAHRPRPLLERLQRKLYRWRVPRDRPHMKALHPAFRLYPDDAGGWRITWRGRHVGATRPLDDLRLAGDTDADSRCFIIASGPSLNRLDLRRLRGRTCIGVNGSIAVTAAAGLTPRYHVIADRDFVRQRFDLTRAALTSGAQCLLTFRVLNEIAERDPGLLGGGGLFLLPQLNTRYGHAKLTPAAFDAWAARQPALRLHPRVRGASDWVGFSTDLALGVFSGQTVAFSALQLACYVGFRTVYIAGLDLGGPRNDYRRAYESPAAGNGDGDRATGPPPAPTRLDRDFEPYILPSFEVAAALCREGRFTVYNLSPESRLPDTVIPVIDFDEALRAAGAPPTSAPTAADARAAWTNPDDAR